MNFKIFGKQVTVGENFSKYVISNLSASVYKYFYSYILSLEVFHYLSQYVVPVVVNARPFVKYSIVDIDKMVAIQLIIKVLMYAWLLTGNTITCTM